MESKDTGKEVVNLLKLNKVIGIDDSKNNILVTLEDGRCALVDRERRGYVVEILLDSFYKWMSFSKEVTKSDEDDAREILNHPNGVGFGPLSERYLSDPKLKQKFDEIKAELGYSY